MTDETSTPGGHDPLVELQRLGGIARRAVSLAEDMVARLEARAAAGEDVKGELAGVLAVLRNLLDLASNVQGTLAKLELPSE